MLADVGQCFLDDPDDLDLRSRGQPWLVGECRLERRRDPGLVTELLEVGPQAVEQASLGSARFAQSEDGLADVPVRLLGEVGELGEADGHPGGTERFDARPEGTEPEVHHAEHLGQAVVHLAGDPLTFGKDRALMLALAHPRALDGNGRELA